MGGVSLLQIDMQASRNKAKIESVALRRIWGHGEGGQERGVKKQYNKLDSNMLQRANKNGWWRETR